MIDFFSSTCTIGNVILKNLILITSISPVQGVRLDGGFLLGAIITTIMENKQPFKIILAYDGTDFHGWQVQPHAQTITSCLADTWQRVFNQPITIVGASRTDAGVHALGQVARFYAQPPEHLSCQELTRVWNSHLPPSIVIRHMGKTTSDFHPCTQVQQKTYYYVLFLRRPLPFVARYGWHYEFIDRVDKEKFYRGLQFYKGTYDFGSFCKIEDEKTTTIRTIDDISIKKIDHHNALLISIKGPGFARFQIRRMVGYALDVARRPNLAVDYIQDLLKNPNPEQTLLKADGRGLCLRKIIYKDGMGY